MDDDSDGHLTAEEFVEAMALPSVEQYLGYLEIHGKEQWISWGWNIFKNMEEIDETYHGKFMEQEKQGESIMEWYDIAIKSVEWKFSVTFRHL